MSMGIRGVQHIGMGVKDYERMKHFYGQTLRMTEVWAEFSEIWNAMSEVFRTSLHHFKGVMFNQKAGGVVVELISMQIPKPCPIREESRYGDIGVNKIAVAVADLGRFCSEYGSEVRLLSAPKTVALPGGGEHHFVYGRDPEGNLIEFFSKPEPPGKELFGGVGWVGLGVTDLERSMAFYRAIGFDRMVTQPHEAFSGAVDEASGSANTKVRSCLLASSNGGEMLELLETLHPRGRSIPFNAHWGDFGYLEVALECEDIHATASQLRSAGMRFLHAPALAFESDEVQYWFLYVYDPDGIPVEVVATMKK